MCYDLLSVKTPQTHCISLFRRMRQEFFREKKNLRLQCHESRKAENMRRMEKLVGGSWDWDVLLVTSQACTDDQQFSKFRPEEDRAVPIFPFHEILMISDGFKLPALYNTQSDLEEVTLNLGVGGMVGWWWWVACEERGQSKVVWWYRKNSSSSLLIIKPTG